MTHLLHEGLRLLPRGESWIYEIVDDDEPDALLEVAVQKLRAWREERPHLAITVPSWR